MNGSSDLCFVDTNVLVYAHDPSAGAKHERAKALVEALWQSSSGCLSIQVLQELYVTLTRKVAKPMSSEAAAEVVDDLSAWRVHVPLAQNVLAAIGTHRRYGISFWDAMIIESAAHSACKCLLTEDLGHDQVYDGVRVVNPFIP